MSNVPLEPNNEPMVCTDMDKVYELVEGKGYYKYFVVIASSIAFLCHMFYLFSTPYFLIRPTAYCKLNGDWTECDWDTVCGGDGVEYRFDKPDTFNFITEFGWYCDESTPPLFTASSFFLGTAFSVCLIGTLSDAFGRVPMLIAGILGNIFGVILLMAFAGPYTCLVSSFLIGFFTMANNSGSFNFVADSVIEKYREMYPTIVSCSLPTGQILISSLMSTGIEWRTMCLINILFSACFFIPFYWLRESPKFYFAQNMIHKAQLRLKNMAMCNRVDASYIKLSNPNFREDEGVSFRKRMEAMCCDLPMFKQIAIVTLMFTVANCAMYAVSLNLENMAGNIFVNGIFLAIAEYIACIMGYVILRLVSPKVSISGSFAIMALGTAGLIFFWKDPFFCLLFSAFSKIGSASVDNLIYTISGMFFPTYILGGALGIGLVGTRFGNVISKPMYLLGIDVMCSLLTVFGIIMAFMPFLLKEQKKEENKDLEATSDDI
eukprot:TRINITY_DN106547_c0_g1_i1.p1 TRINITY_DN106547_c0_g1~~TRINITY_DN106547_c0_g1_i1.p1  ORF type:complete len:490 (-),score=13.23 TRINITY_DN106547_c0_g1_i1:172-1641(-)